MYKGSQIQSKESFLYGRFETMMQPAFGSGIISSFFMFYDGNNFQNNWNQIDFEFLGRNTNTLNTNFMRTENNKPNMNINVVQNVLEKRSSDVFWKLCIEWTPNRVTWKINDVIIRTADVSMKTPMKLFMSIWAWDSDWSGKINTGLLPQQALYKYIRYSSYENNNFVFKWQDSFHALDETKWYISVNNIKETTFVKNNVSIQDKNLKLTLL